MSTQEIEDDTLFSDNQPSAKQLETLEDYIKKYKEVNEQVLSMQCQLEMLNREPFKYQSQPIKKRISWLEKDLVKQRYALGNLVLTLSHAIAWCIPEIRRAIITDYIFSGKTLQKIAYEHSLDCDFVKYLIDTYGKTAVREQVEKTYGKIFEN